MADNLVIKKYTNRRLYDTEKNSYVTLRQVADLIKSGRQVEVVDAKSNEDVTSFILTQIVLEEAREKNLLLPVPLLHLLIRYGDNALNDFFEKHLQQVLQNYLLYKNSVDDQFSKWLELGTDYAAKAKETFSQLPAFQPMFDLFLTPSVKTANKEKRNKKKK